MIKTIFPRGVSSIFACRYLAIFSPTGVLSTLVWSIIVSSTIVSSTIVSLAWAQPKNVQPEYKRTIDALRISTSVIPPKPELHPVTAMYNREAIIPPQCYTRTEGTHNPCYVCHQNAIEGRENTMNDGALQLAYSFSDQGMTNHWQNLFEDRGEKIAAISDGEILSWINTDNFSELAPRLKQAGFAGWIPDIKNLHLGEDAFDANGFALDGSHWVAFNYKPLPSTFWPTNGSTDDVMIRLPEVYRNTKDGNFSVDVYRANLAIVEAAIKGRDEMRSLPVDEKSVGVDLNLDGDLSMVTHIKVTDSYVGAASDYYLETYLYPEGTEFLHTVRYVGVDTKSGDIGVSSRMKEVRYMKKWRSYNKAVYARNYELEAYEKEAGNLPGYTSVGDHGLDNGSGWAIQSFIEGVDGRLRVATHEENFFCIGCHNSVGATVDKTFSFARKVDGDGGWGYINLKGMPDAPNVGETDGEILTYFIRAGGGDEFRSNTEMLEKWFKPDGSVNTEKVRAAPDVYSLITPSVERALTLNKSYKVIVDEQSFILGRDATSTPPQNVYDAIDNATAPTLTSDKFYSWDIRLDWNTGASE